MATKTNTNTPTAPPKVTATPDPSLQSSAQVLNQVLATPDPTLQSAAQYVPSFGQMGAAGGGQFPQITATPDPNLQSAAQVYPAQISATPAGLGGSAARVQYPGQQITASPETPQHPNNFWGHFLNTVQQMANSFGPPNPQAQRTKSAAKVSDESTNPGGGAGAIGSVSDPTLAPPPDPNALAMQMFFQNTIAPYLNQLRVSMGHNAESLGTAFADVRKDINPALRPFFNQERVQAQTGGLADALAASVAAGPSYDQLLAQISAAQEAQKYAAYQAMKAQSGQAAGGLLGSLLGASGGEGTDDFIKQLTGGK